MKMLFKIILWMIFNTITSIPAHVATLEDSTIFKHGFSKSDSTTTINYSKYSKGIFIASNSNIEAIEFFFDTDPGFGKGSSLPVSPFNNVLIKTTIETAHLSPGLHCLYIRAKNETGKWGIVHSKPIFITQKIEPHDSLISASKLEKIEYFFDEPPSLGNFNSLEVLPNSEVNLTATLDVSDLVPGLHRLYIRAQDESGTWGVVQSKPLFITQRIEPHDNLISASKVENVEYFFDESPGFEMGNNLDIMAHSEISLTATIDVSNLLPGLHRLYIRAKNETGTWGVIQSKPIFITQKKELHGSLISASKLEKIEYFFDEPHGHGNGNSLEVLANSEVSLTATLDVSDLIPGLHRLYIRAQDEAGTWGVIQSKPLFITQRTEPHDNLISASKVENIEYFFDEPPGFGMGKSLKTIVSSEINLTETINVLHLNPGLHQLHIRAQDDTGSWGIVQSKPVFIVKHILPDRKGNVTEIEYFFDYGTTLSNAQQLSFTSQNSVSYMGKIDISQLSPGLHRLYIRAKDEFDIWGIVQSRQVLIEMIDYLPDIINIEYFFNYDPGQGFGKGLIFEPNNYVHIQTNIPVDNLPEGNHQIYVRAQDENKNWSSTRHSQFSISKVPEISMIPDQTILETTISHCIHFTIVDGLMNEDLTISSSSSNLSLINAQNILITQTGSSYEILLTPVHNTCGHSTITVMAGNQFVTSTVAFDINVLCSLIGDINTDRIINIKDVIMILKRLVRSK